MPVLSVANQQRRRSRDDPQDLEAERGHDVALGAHDHRHAADQAVALGLDREQATAGRDLLDDRHVAQAGRGIRTGNFSASSSPTVATPVKGSDLSISDEIAGCPVSPSTTCERLIASARIWSLLGSSRSLVAGGVVEIAHLARDQIRIEPVGFGEHHVEADRHRAVAGEVAGSGPRSACAAMAIGRAWRGSCRRCRRW